MGHALLMQVMMTASKATRFFSHLSVRRITNFTVFALLLLNIFFSSLGWSANGRSLVGPSKNDHGQFTVPILVLMLTAGYPLIRHSVQSQWPRSGLASLPAIHASAAEPIQAASVLPTLSVGAALPAGRSISGASLITNVASESASVRGERPLIDRASSNNRGNTIAGAHPSSSKFLPALAAAARAMRKALHLDAAVEAAKPNNVARTGRRLRARAKQQVFSYVVRQRVEHTRQKLANIGQRLSGFGRHAP